MLQINKIIMLFSNLIFTDVPFKLYKAAGDFGWIDFHIYSANTIFIIFLTHIFGSSNFLLYILVFYLYVLFAPLQTIIEYLHRSH